MKIGFVSLMRVASWGGSEELWSKTALLALINGYSVQTLTCNWVPVPSQISKLQKHGVDTKFYFTHDSLALLDRLIVRFKIKKSKSTYLPFMDADVYVLSNGNIWDFIRHRNITDYIISTNKPFIIIGHNTLDWGDNLNIEQRSYAINVFKQVSRLLFVSERNWRGAERQLAHRIKNAQIVENPVSILNISIKPYPESSRLLMASVGSLDCYYKGQDLLIEALSSEVWRNRDFELKIYGKGPQEQYLRDLIDMYGLQDKVTLEGHVKDVDQIWENSQVLVMSSLSEGVPMVIVEAMLSGRSVLGTDVGAAERYIEEGKTGFLVPVAKVKYLEMGLEKLWHNRPMLKKMGEQAFERASTITNPHPEKTLLNIIEDVYNEVGFSSNKGV